MRQSYPVLEMLVQDVPAWYKISWEENLPGLIISLKHEIMPELNRLMVPGIPLITMYQKDNKLALDSFILPANPNWGFGGIFEAIEPDDTFCNYQIKIPSVEINRDKYQYCWEKAINISASLGALTTFLEIVEITNNPSPEPQLVTFTLSAEARSVYGYTIHVQFSKVLTDWLRTFGKERYLDEISLVMSKVWFTFFPCRPNKTSLARHHLKALYRPPCWLNFDVPGDACGLDPNDYSDRGEGYQLSPHNTDTPAQQLTLLAGVAKLCDLYRAAHPAPS